MNIKTQDILTSIFALTLAIMGSQPVRAMQKQEQQAIPIKGFTMINTEKYILQVPTGWSIGAQTPWGARDITPKVGPGQMGAMTAGPTTQSWADLYKTSLFYIKREEAGTETPYRTGKTKKGYECISFEVKNKEGFTNRMYTLIKNAEGNVLALSIKIPTPESVKTFKAMFQHMIETAQLKS